MRRLLFLGAAVALAALPACSPPTPARDVAYYRDHPDDRAAKLTACRNNRGKLAFTSDCINALAANSQGVSKTFWTASRPRSRVANPGKL